MSAQAVPEKTRDDRLERLWQAIHEHTQGDDMFWLGVILLSEIEKETGYQGRPRTKQ